MSLLSIRMLETFEGETGYPVPMARNGYLFVLTQETELEAFRHGLRLQHILGVETEWLSADDVRDWLPMFQLDDILAATFYGRDGIADPTNVIRGYIAMANRLGALLVPRSPVVDIQADVGQTWRVTTAQGTIVTPIVVNAAGPWAAQIAAMMGVHLPITPRRHQGFLIPHPESISVSLPTAIFPAEGIGFRPDGPHILVGSTNFAEPPTFDQEQIDWSFDAALYAAAQRRLPCLDQSSIVMRWVGLYEMTPDIHPILGRIPEVEGFYCIVGFSGHGFMHAPIGGLLVSEEILDGKAHTLNIDPLRVDRFHKTERIRESAVI